MRHAASPADIDGSRRKAKDFTVYKYIYTSDSREFAGECICVKTLGSSSEAKVETMRL